MSRLNIINPIVTYLLFLPLTLGAIAPKIAQAQESPTPPAANVNSSSASILSLEGGQNLLQEADAAIDAQQFDVAADKLQKARQVFNQLSNFYLQLFNSFSGLDNRVAESQRQKALETGQLRDKATYQLALVHRAQNQPELSVPLLIQIISSQSPTSGLGKQAYQQLNEIGFVDEPFTEPDPGNANPGNANPGNTNPGNANPGNSEAIK